MKKISRGQGHIILIPKEVGIKLQGKNLKISMNLDQNFGKKCLRVNMLKNLVKIIYLTCQKIMHQLLLKNNDLGLDLSMNYITKNLFGMVEMYII